MLWCGVCWQCVSHSLDVGVVRADARERSGLRHVSLLASAVLRRLLSMAAKGGVRPDCTDGNASNAPPNPPPLKTPTSPQGLKQCQTLIRPGVYRIEVNIQHHTAH